jgi:hypothetical protein
VVRILVVVLDANAVPRDADVVVNRSMYKIFFKVDEVVRDEDDFNPEEDDLLDEDDQANDHDTEAMDEPEPNGGDGKKPDERPAPADKYNGMSPTKQAALVEEAIDMACERLIEELSY